MPARCPPGKILNPETKRCVKRDGKIGRQILAARREQKQLAGHPASATSGAASITLPSDMVQQIWHFVPRKARNCGHFIKMLLTRYDNNLQNISDTLRGRLQVYVRKTLQMFRDKLRPTHIIQYLAVQSQASPAPMMQRVKDAIALCKKTEDPAVLLSLCKLVVGWKHEARQILNEYINVLEYALDVVDGRPKREGYMGSLWAPDEFPVNNINNFPRYELMEWCRFYESALSKDFKRLAILQQPIDVK